MDISRHRLLRIHFLTFFILPYNSSFFTLTFFYSLPLITNQSTMYLTFLFFIDSTLQALSLVGPQTIEEMKALAVDMFSDIKNRGSVSSDTVR